jgi:hypothetical protein
METAIKQRWHYDDGIGPEGVFMYWIWSVTDMDHYFIYPFIRTGYVLTYENWNIPMDRDTTRLGEFISLVSAKRAAKEHRVKQHTNGGTNGNSTTTE